MKIEIDTNHDILENVYFMFNNTICQGMVSKISITQKLTLHNPYTEGSDIGEENTEVYEVKGYACNFKKENLFKTEKDLIISLQKP